MCRPHCSTAFEDVATLPRSASGAHWELPASMRSLEMAAAAKPPAVTQALVAALLQRACVGGGELGTGEVQLAFTACLGQSAASTFSPEWCNRVGGGPHHHRAVAHEARHGGARRALGVELRGWRTSD